MRRRLYFLLPDLESARLTANDLLLARVEFRHMHFLARRGTDLGDLHEANPLQKTDLVHGAEVGLVLGGVCGLLLGLFIVFSPPRPASRSSSSARRSPTHVSSSTKPTSRRGAFC